MPKPLTTGATITCPHGGTGTSIATSPIMTISGQTVLVENDTGTLTCPFIIYPCVGYTLRAMGHNAMTIDGRKAILETDFQQSVTGLPLTIVESQQICKDSTSPASSGGGGGGGGGGDSGGGAETSSGDAGDPVPLPPELLDESKPTVTATPGMLAFDTMTQMPATLPVAFTLAHPYPLEWQLRLINTVAKTDVPLTGGAPGATVSPSGGDWSDTSFSVNLTLTAVFMTALGKTAAAPHELYFTGISQRGVSAFAVVKLTIT